MADDDLGTGSVTITLNDAAATASLDRLADRIEDTLAQAARDGIRRMEREINNAIRRISPVRLTAELNTQQVEAALGQLASQTTNVTIMPEINRDQFINAIQAALVGATVSVNTIPNLDGFNTAIRAHNTPDISVNVRADTREADREISSLGKALGGLAGLAGTVAQIGALGTAAFGAVAGVAALGAALAPAAGIIAAGPAAILGYQAALGGLKLALSGVSEAFESALTGDAEEFAEAIENLSPKAQAAAREVRALKPAFEELRSTVQDGFFAQIEGEITRTAQALQGPLTTGLTNISEGWGKAAQNALGYIQGAQGVSNITSILGASGQAVDGLALGTNKLVAGFLQVAASVSDGFGERFGSAISGATEGIGTFLQDIAQSGQAVSWVEGALTLFKQLGAIVGNIGTILGTVFGQAAEAGGGLLARFEQMTAQVADFVQSAEGTQLINTLFEVLSGVSGVLGQTFAALLTVVKAVAPAFTVIAGAITPLLPVIGKLIGELASGLAPIIAQVAGVIGNVLKAALDVITPILPVIVDAFLKIVKAVSPLVPILGNVLVQAVNALWPLLSTLANALSTIATAVAPLITQLIEGLSPILQSIAPLFGRLVAAVAPLITSLVEALLPVLPPLIDAFLAVMTAIEPLNEPLIALTEALVPLVTLLIEALAPVIQFAAEIIKWAAIEGLVPVIENMTDALTKIVGVLIAVVEGVVSFGTDFEANIKAMTEAVSSTITQWIANVQTFFTNLWTTVRTTVTNWKNDVVRIVGEMTKSVTTAITNWVTSIGNWFITLNTRVLNTVRSMINSVVTFFRNLPGQTVNALANLGSSLVNVMTSAGSRFVRRVSSVVSDAVDVIADFPRDAARVLANVGNYLYSAGQDLIWGFIRGIYNQAQSLYNSIRDVVGGAVDAAKGLLGINSPSKVFFEIGEFSGEGLINGFNAMVGKVKAAAGGMAASVGSAFLNVPLGSRSPVPSAVGIATAPFNTDRQIAGRLKQRSRQADQWQGGRAGWQNTFNIYEVGDAETTARRVLNRLVDDTALL